MKLIECEHVWELRIEYIGMPPASEMAIVGCKHCPKRLIRSQAESRLNATERLSALNAAFIYAKLAQAGGVPDDILDAIRAYAKSE